MNRLKLDRSLILVVMLHTRSPSLVVLLPRSPSLVVMIPRSLSLAVVNLCLLGWVSTLQLPTLKVILSQLTRESREISSVALGTLDTAREGKIKTCQWI